MSNELQWADDNENISEKISIAQVWELVDQGSLHSDSLCWQEGMEGWTRWADCQHRFPRPHQQAAAAAATDAAATSVAGAAGLELGAGEPAAAASVQYTHIHFVGVDHETGEERPSDATPVAEVQQFIDLGNLTADSLVWIEGMPAWTPLGECFHLFGLVLPSGGGHTEQHKIDSIAPEPEPGDPRVQPSAARLRWSKVATERATIVKNLSAVKKIRDFEQMLISAADPPSVSGDTLGGLSEGDLLHIYIEGSTDLHKLGKSNICCVVFVDERLVRALAATPAFRYCSHDHD